MNWILLPFRIVFAVSFTVLCAIMGIVAGLADPSKRAGLWVGARFWSPITLWILGAKFSVIGADNAKGCTKHVFVANHESMVDILTVFYGVPELLSFVGKKELKKVPFLGWAMLACDMIFIDRGNRDKAYESIRLAGEKIRSGKPVIVFPEGTRNRKGEVGMFKKGSFVIAVENQLDIVPMAIYGAWNIIRPDSIIIRPGKVSLVIGKPIYMADHRDKTAEQMADFVRMEVLKLREIAKQQVETP